MPSCLRSSAFHLPPYSVGTLHSPACLEHLAQKDSWELISQLDFLEIRLDGVKEMTLPEVWPQPMIATARLSEEGGRGSLNVQERKELLEKAILWASAIDIELRSFDELQETIDFARAESVQIIASFHDFEKAPSFTELKKILLQAEKQRADFLKIAVTLRTEEELQELLLFQQDSSLSSVRVATMGMGVLGVRSRQLLVKAGSALMYGWVYQPQIEGQWSAEEMLTKQVTSEE